MGREVSTISSCFNINIFITAKIHVLGEQIKKLFFYHGVTAVF